MIITRLIVVHFPNSTNNINIIFSQIITFNFSQTFTLAVLACCKQKHSQKLTNVVQFTNDSYELNLFSESKIHSVTSLIPQIKTLISWIFFKQTNYRFNQSEIQYNNYISTVYSIFFYMSEKKYIQMNWHQIELNQEICIDTKLYKLHNCALA